MPAARGFYTDEKGRKRPITGKKRNPRIQPSRYYRNVTKDYIDLEKDEHGIVIHEYATRDDLIAHSQAMIQKRGKVYKDKRLKAYFVRGTKWQGKKVWIATKSMKVWRLGQYDTKQEAVDRAIVQIRKSKVSDKRRIKRIIIIDDFQPEKHHQV